MNVRGHDIVNDANSMFDYINRFKGKDFILDRVEKEHSKQKVMVRWKILKFVFCKILKYSY